MTDELPGKRYGAVNAWPEAGAPGHWRYLPHEPAPQRGADGRAMVTAIEAGGMLILTLGTSLAASESEQAAAKAAIAAETRVPPSEVDLRPADASVGGAALVLTVDGEPPVELATAKPSPVAPYPAAFSAMLQGDRAKQATAAMKSGKGRLSVRYDVELPATRAVTARLTGDPAGVEDVEAAIAGGRLTLTLVADPGASDALKADARKRVGEQAAQLLGRVTTPADNDCGLGEVARGATLDAAVTRTEPAPVAVRLQANVTEWLG
jgi:hypothetical protein